MLNSLKKLFGAKPGKVILAPVAGQAVPISQVPDPTFGEEILGKGIAIKPTSGRVVAPADGTVSLMFDTGHAVSFVTDDGTEVLIHIGLDTIKLEGKHYVKHKANGDKVKAGDLLIEFDIAGIEAAGYNVITPVVICNTADYKEVVCHTGNAVAELDEIITLKD